jgi:predicted dehydrogenase
VLVEKPVAPTVASTRALANHPRAGAVAVAAPLRAHAGFRRFIELLPQVGSPVSAHVSCHSWLPDWRPDRDYRESYSARADEGGVLRDLVHEIDYSSALFGEAHLLGAALEHDGPLEMEAEQAASLLWSTTTAQVTMRLDYISRPGERRCTVHGPKGMLQWNVLTQTVTLVSVDGEITQTFEQDRDRDRVMGTQVMALLKLGPDAPAALRIPAGAPATLAEGLDVLSLCDRARALNQT